MFFLESVQKWGIRIFYVLFCCFMLYRLVFAGGAFFDRSISYLSYPFLKVHSGVSGSIDGVKERFRTLYSLKEELHDAHDDIEQLEARVIELEQQASFQEQTKELVSFSHRYKESFHLLAKVLMRKHDNKDHMLFLDAGSRKGIQKNMIVVSKNCLVGRIIRVYPLYSEVVCITDHRCKVTVNLYKKKIEGIYEGVNSQLGVLKFIPHFEPVSVGDRIYSAGKGLLYPQGFLLGTVESVKPGAVDQEISIHPAVDFDSLQYLYVIKS
jgi:rod shape-determining protein MreC